MQLVTTSPRPVPQPTWTGITLARASSGMAAIGVASTGAIGRPEGYDSQANAMRAAYNLSRGVVRDAAAVIGSEGRWYVQGVRLTDPVHGAWRAPLSFEAAFPATAGPMVIDAGTPIHAHVAGLVAIVDGARSLRIVR